MGYEGEGEKEREREDWREGGREIRIVCLLSRLFKYFRAIVNSHDLSWVQTS